MTRPAAGFKRPRKGFRRRVMAAMMILVLGVTLNVAQRRSTETYGGSES